MNEAEKVRLAQELERITNNLRYWRSQLSEAEEMKKKAEEMIATHKGATEALRFALQEEK